jgi:hypothetical protein
VTTSNDKLVDFLVLLNARYSFTLISKWVL